MEKCRYSSSHSELQHYLPISLSISRCEVFVPGIYHIGLRSISDAIGKKKLPILAGDTNPAIQPMSF
jgi:hypothetical protein